MDRKPRNRIDNQAKNWGTYEIYVVRQSMSPEDENLYTRKEDRHRIQKEGKRARLKIKRQLSFRPG